jgi:RHS repeat-associated protein
LTTDNLGSPRIITDQAGNVIARHDYAAFGEEISTPQRTSGIGYVADNIRFDYTGYQKDDESGLEFAQARYFNPKHGRFTSIDPLTASATIKNPQTFNRYSYGLNSPHKFTDPLGLASVSQGSPCGQFCRNSDPRGDVDGSAFSGTDTYFKKMFEDMAAQREQQQQANQGQSGEIKVTKASLEYKGQIIATGEIKEFAGSQSIIFEINEDSLDSSQLENFAKGKDRFILVIGLALPNNIEKMVPTGKNETLEGSFTPKESSVEMIDNKPKEEKPPLESSTSKIIVEEKRGEINFSDISGDRYSKKVNATFIGKFVSGSKSDSASARVNIVGVNNKGEYVKTRFKFTIKCSVCQSK